MKHTIKKIWLIFAQSITISLALALSIKLILPEFFTKTPDNNNSPAIFTSPSSQIHSYHLAASKAMPSVVNIFTIQRIQAQPKFHHNDLLQKFFGNQFEYPSARQNRLGSGVIIRSDGYIVTNHHVIESAETIKIALNNGKIYSAKIIGDDPDTDLAVLKIDAIKLPSIEFAESNLHQVGDIVLAIGNPFGVGQTITQGIISGLSRNHLGINTFEDFIQTDAAINPGNSGGALINTNGQLVGINSAIFSKDGGSMGIGFAIPVSIVNKVVTQIIQHGSVTRGWIGVQAQDLDEELRTIFNAPAQFGCLVSGIIAASPADKAGIKVGDVVFEIDNKKFSDTSSMIKLISELPPGSSKQINLIRDSKLISVIVTIGKRPLMKRLVND